MNQSFCDNFIATVIIYHNIMHRRIFDLASSDIICIYFLNLLKFNEISLISFHAFDHLLKIEVP